MIANAKTLRQSEVSLRRKSNGMEASLLPRKNYASAISDRLNVDPIEQGGEKFHRITKDAHDGSSRGMVSPCPPRLCLASFIAEQRLFYRRNKSNPVIASMIPRIRCQDAGSRKNKIPAMAMMAAPQARIAGTAESGPPF